MIDQVKRDTESLEEIITKALQVPISKKIQSFITSVITL